VISELCESTCRGPKFGNYGKDHFVSGLSVFKSGCYVKRLVEDYGQSDIQVKWYDNSVSDEVIHFVVIVFNKHHTTTTQMTQMAQLPTVGSSKSFQLGKWYDAVYARHFV